MRQQTQAEHPGPTAEQITELTEAVLILTDQVRMLRLAVDEIEQELGWAIRTQVLDRVPRPEFPCDARLLDEPAEDIAGLEHFADEVELPDEELPDDATSNSVPAPNPRRQPSFW
jgi:hypothetical protein